MSKASTGDPSELERDYAPWVRKIRLIKTDTEGNDLSVLKGFRNIIAEARPYIITEIYARMTADERRELADYVRSFGYRIYRADPWKTLKGEMVGPDDLTRWKHFDIFCEPE